VKRHLRRRESRRAICGRIVPSKTIEAAPGRLDWLRFGLPAESDQRLENVEGHLLRMNDPAKVMEGRLPLFHIVNRDVVFSQNVLRFVFRHFVPR
jgi:hypothetical protein